MSVLPFLYRAVDAILSLFPCLSFFGIASCLGNANNQKDKDKK